MKHIHTHLCMYVCMTSFLATGSTKCEYENWNKNCEKITHFFENFYTKYFDIKTGTNIDWNSSINLNANLVHKDLEQLKAAIKEAISPRKFSISTPTAPINYVMGGLIIGIVAGYFLCVVNISKDPRFRKFIEWEEEEKQRNNYALTLQNEKRDTH